MRFNGTAGKKGFRNYVDDLSDILTPKDGSMIAIATYTGAGNADRGVCGYFRANSDEFSILKNLSYFRAHNNYWNAADAINTIEIGISPSIYTSQFSHSEGRLKNYYNNKPNGAGSYNNNGGGILSNSGLAYFSVGEVPTGNIQHFNGSIAEVIVFAKNISYEERLRSESYLAIKYGVTMGSQSNPVDYASSNAQNPQRIWKAEAVYQNNIIGIGFDKVSELNQKQSHQRDDTVRIYLRDIKETNKDNIGVFYQDKSYVVMGSNEKKLYATDKSNAIMYEGMAKSPCHLFSKIEREWKIQRTNMPDKFNIDIKLDKFAKLNLIDVNDLRLLVDKDNNFENGWEGCYAKGDDGLDISYANGIVTFKDISIDHIPNDDIRYISIGSDYRGTPLPVGLTSFTAECSRTNVELIWETKSETNNDYFTIEKSNDGVNFETLAKLEGQGNKNSASLYSLTDYTNQVGISYYRLSQTDFDGKETALKTISSNCEGDLEVVIHPNPTNNGVYLTLNNSEKSLEVTIYNLSGKVISRNEVHGSAWLQLPNEDGIYLIKYVLDGEEHVEKVVKI
ncbi:T9SS type A sorting domain-containing protein [Brumimicrobium glaciale]|uniref:T9SS type A sorting domain-containing protein n=1 Tax=Brumimicrobium glaciale TaxID=200475 RepID=A0A4Q4KP83_9FLAO|nr:T9SS type A sorting domain-containing protein [Brumimicrobium glaciale]RYM35162.1 T9SS type A sorting domain-containing protein [Brumimicrobium glaciale]